MKIEDLELSIRTQNAMKQAGIIDVVEILNMNRVAMNSIQNLGQKSLNELLFEIIKVMKGDFLKSVKEYDAYCVEKNVAYVEFSKRYQEIKAIVER